MPPGLTDGGCIRCAADSWIVMAGCGRPSTITIISFRNNWCEWMPRPIAILSGSNCLLCLAWPDGDMSAARPFLWTATRNNNITRSRKYFIGTTTTASKSGTVYVMSVLSLRQSTSSAPTLYRWQCKWSMYSLSLHMKIDQCESHDDHRWTSFIHLIHLP